MPPYECLLLVSLYPRLDKHRESIIFKSLFSPKPYQQLHHIVAIFAKLRYAMALSNSIYFDQY